MEGEVEIWKYITGYEKLYKVSNLGNIKSLKFKKEKKLKLIKNLSGYYTINLSKESVVKTFNVHRLVAIHFVPNLENLSDVNHIDLDRLNNHYLNLEWTSRRENIVHKFKNKTTSSKYCGVSWYKNCNKWVSEINFNNKKTILGKFDSEIEAYKARVNFEKENGIINKYI